MEDVWGNMVSSWDPARECNPQAFMAHINRSWETLRNKPEVIRKMVASMPDRLAEVMEMEEGAVLLLGNYC